MRYLVVLIGLMGCSGETTEPVGCRDDGDCPALSVCQEDGECLQVECVTSTQCGLGSFCDTTSNQCVGGCETEDDCLSGFSCDAGQCTESACEDSQIDCKLGETCNLDVGVCEADMELCMSCSGEGRDICQDDIGGRCWWFSSGQYCLPPCSPFADQAKLPRGFSCIDWGSSEEDFYLFGDCDDVEVVRNPPEDEE